MLSHKGKKELKEKILDALKDGFLVGTPVSEIHHEVFNQDDFIIGHYPAEQWMIAHAGGVFAAIAEVQAYENDNFGEVTTEISQAQKLLNMYVYIKGEEIINEFDFILDNWDEDLTQELCDEFITLLEKE